MDSISEVKAFTDEVGKTGTWNGEAIEGFVVRTHVVEPPPQESSKNASPYAPGSTFFFKVKFDEPYMMYRDWREVTKKLLTAKGPLELTSLPKNKMKRPETKVYVKWVKEEIKRDRSAFSLYTNNRGIISTRERFLKWLASEDGKKGLMTADNEEDVKLGPQGPKEFGKTIIVPIAVPGCGTHNVFPLSLSRHTNASYVQEKHRSQSRLRTCLVLVIRKVTMCRQKNQHLPSSRTWRTFSKFMTWLSPTSKTFLDSSMIIRKLTVKQKQPSTSTSRGPSPSCQQLSSSCSFTRLELGHRSTSSNGTSHYG